MNATKNEIEVMGAQPAERSWYATVYTTPVYEVRLGITSSSLWHVQLTPCGRSVVVIGGGSSWRTPRGGAAKDAHGVPIDADAERLFGVHKDCWSSWRPGEDWRGEIARAVQAAQAA